MLAELRAEKAAELDGVYTRILDEATTQLLDRVRNGDPYIVGGEVKRKPVAARDLALVAAITFDKRALARNQPEAIPKADYTLQELADWLEWSGRRSREQQEGAGRRENSIS
jgi:hypothetical protein